MITQYDIQINEQDLSKFWNTSIKSYPEIGVMEVFYMPAKVMKKGQGGGLRGSQENQQKKDENQERAIRRATTKIRETILANNMQYLWTLTYADEETRRDVVRDDYRLFMRRLRYMLVEKVPFVAVLEIQKERAEKCGKPVLHIHFATDRRINVKYVEKAWKNGFVWVEKISGDVCHVAGYMAKYIKKDLEASGRTLDENRYMVSLGLKKPDREAILMSDEDFKMWRSKADIVKEFEQGVWLRITARTSDKETKQFYLVKQEGKKEVEKIG